MNKLEMLTPFVPALASLSIIQIDVDLPVSMVATLPVLAIAGAWALLAWRNFYLCMSRLPVARVSPTLNAPLPLDFVHHVKSQKKVPETPSRELHYTIDSRCSLPAIYFSTTIWLHVIILPVFSQPIAFKDSCLPGSLSSIPVNPVSWPAWPFHPLCLWLNALLLDNNQTTCDHPNQERRCFAIFFVFQVLCQWLKIFTSR